jgi:hypothetical protein
VGVGVVPGELVRAVGEGAGGGEVAEAFGFGPVDLRAEGGVHVVGGENEVDEAPETIAAGGAREALAADGDQALERAALRRELDQEALDVVELIRMLFLDPRPVEKRRRAMLQNRLGRLHRQRTSHGGRTLRRRCP